MGFFYHTLSKYAAYSAKVLKNKHVEPSYLIFLHLKSQDCTFHQINSKKTEQEIAWKYAYTWTMGGCFIHHTRLRINSSFISTQFMYNRLFIAPLNSIVFRAEVFFPLKPSKTLNNIICIIYCICNDPFFANHLSWKCTIFQFF